MNKEELKKIKKEIEYLVNKAYYIGKLDGLEAAKQMIIDNEKKNEKN